MGISPRTERPSLEEMKEREYQGSFNDPRLISEVLFRYIHYIGDKRIKVAEFGTDMDGTLIEDARIPVLTYMHQNGLFRNPTLLERIRNEELRKEFEMYNVNLDDPHESARYHAAVNRLYHALLGKDTQMERRDAFKMMVRSLAGYSVTDIDRIVQQALEESPPLGIVRDMIDILQVMMDLGAPILVVTSAPQYVAVPAINMSVIPQLKTYEDNPIRVRGLELKVDENSILTPDILSPRTYYEGKVNVLVEERKPYAFFAGDSRVDGKAMEWVTNQGGTAILVYRTDIHGKKARLDLRKHVCGELRGLLIQHHREQENGAKEGTPEGKINITPEEGDRILLSPEFDLPEF